MVELAVKLVQKWLKNLKNWPKIRWKSTEIYWKIGPKTVEIEFNLCKGLKGSWKSVEIWLTRNWLIFFYQKINVWISYEIGPKVVLKKLTENLPKVKWKCGRKTGSNQIEIGWKIGS